jgi:riboflavin synthase
MFTGIIESTGKIVSLRRAHGSAKISVRAGSLSSELKIGDSIAVNGVCLTATRTEGGEIFFDLSPETLERTSFSICREGTMVNLERSLGVGARLGGHFVLGHVDGMGTLGGIILGLDGGAVVTIEYPQDLGRYIVFKGSIAVDGISLTVASLTARSFTVAVIPHTLNATNLASLRRGDPINLEVDILGKYVARFLESGYTPASGSKLTLDYLKDQGF